MENGSAGARLKTLCGLLCDKSAANEAPDRLLMMRREKAHHNASCISLSLTLSIAAASEAS